MNMHEAPTTIRSRHVLPRPKVDLYGAVHKGLRKALSEVVIRLGNTSWATPAAYEPVLDELEAVLRFCDQHIGHEDGFVRPAVEARLPGAYGRIDDEHADHVREVRDLRAYAAATRTCDASERGLVGRMLYLHASHFVAATLAHMAQEEEVLQPLLDRTFATEELAAIHGALLASIPPPEMLASLRIMIPAMSPEERAEMLGGARHAMPPEAFDALLGTLAGVLAPVDHADLRERLAAAA